MKVIGKDKIARFGRKHNRARKPLAMWLKKTEAARWQKFADVKATFATADNPVNNEYIFNIGGNYRLTAFVVIVNETVLIKSIMTHEQYSKKYKA
jgi:mRNA interferase HigB